jgi:serine protease Do
MANKKTLYDILEITPDADDELIGLAYRRLLAIAASDADGNRRGLIKEAYSVLSNAQQRVAYNASLSRLAAAAEGLGVDSGVNVEPDARRWPVWLAVGICLAIGIVWWQAKRKPAPVVISQTIVAAADPSANSAAMAATDAGVKPKTPEELYSSLSGSVALIVVADAKGNPLRSGSGVVIADGAVITNCHVTKDSSQIKVKVAGKVHDASIYTTDEVYDLCRLSVTGLSASPVSIGSVAALRTGQKVYAIGAPHGLELTISDGMVSSLRETPTGTYIQTTAPISPGSSGGGLFTASGQLVGIVTFQHRLGQNLNFAVPADWIAQMQERGATPTSAEETPAAAPTDLATLKDPHGIRSRLLGTWHCYRPALGRHMTMQFQSGGTMTVTVNAKPYQGNYEVNGKVLTLTGSDTLSVTVDELTESRMTLGMNSEKRMACDRQG